MLSLFTHLTISIIILSLGVVRAADCGCIFIANECMYLASSKQTIPDGFWVWVAGEIEGKPTMTLVTDALGHRYALGISQKGFGNAFRAIAGGEMHIKDGKLQAVSDESVTIQSLLVSRDGLNAFEARTANNPEIAYNFATVSLGIQVADGFFIKRNQRDQKFDVHLNPVYNEIAKNMGGSINVRHSIDGGTFGLVSITLYVLLKGRKTAEAVLSNNLGITSSSFRSLMLFFQLLESEGVLDSNSSLRELISELDRFAFDHIAGTTINWELTRVQRLQELLKHHWQFYKNIDTSNSESNQPYNLKKRSLLFILQ